MTPAERDSDNRDSQTVDSAELNLLRAIVEGTAPKTGEDFFRTLVRNLCAATGARGAFVAQLTHAGTRVRPIAYWDSGAFSSLEDWELAGTPCEEVIGGGLCHYPSGVSIRYPEEVGIESYLGVPLLNAHGECLGHLAMLDGVAMPMAPRLIFTFRIFAARATAELERLKMVEQLHASEERFRDLFDEAPIAYVLEDLESRFIRANRTAMRTLGLKPEDIDGMVGITLAADGEDAQRRIREAFASINRGIDTSGVVLEMRRRNDGGQVFIEWWSRPDPNGEYTRTMFIDVTERVLMEREQARLKAENLYFQNEISAVQNFDGVVGKSKAIRSLLGEVRRVAKTDATVLIRGETGTGKELIARAIHNASDRRDKPLIKVNCAALPSSLVESELFGHEKGAFTGATAKRIGRFELAEGGTIFLDEVGEIPLDVQAKLLRVLQEREFERVGGGLPVKVDVRVVAATNRDLLAMVANRAFREDLYYRLCVFPVITPPLRDRADDIPLLASFLVKKYSTRFGKHVEGIGAASLRHMQAYRWPGNVRELENVIERAVILSDEPLMEIDVAMLPGLAEDHAGELAARPREAQIARPAADPPMRRSDDHAQRTAAAGNRDRAPAASSADASLKEIERQHVLAVLAGANWVIEGPKGAAKILDMRPSTLRHRMGKLGIVARRN